MPEKYSGRPKPDPKNIWVTQGQPKPDPNMKILKSIMKTWGKCRLQLTRVDPNFIDPYLTRINIQVAPNSTQTWLPQTQTRKIQGRVQVAGRVNIAGSSHIHTNRNYTKRHEILKWKKKFLVAVIQCRRVQCIPHAKAQQKAQDPWEGWKKKK